MQISEVRKKIAKNSSLYRYLSNKCFIGYPYSTNSTLKSVLNRLDEDREMIPDISPVLNGIKPSFIRGMEEYDESLFDVSELLCFVFASVNDDFDIVKGQSRGIISPKKQYWLTSGSIVYSPGLGLVINKDEFEKYFKELTVLENEMVLPYAGLKDNLRKFYKKDFFSPPTDFTTVYLENIRHQHTINLAESFPTRKSIAKHGINFQFMNLRSLFMMKREYEIIRPGISVHPEIDSEISKEIISGAQTVSERTGFDYFDRSYGNCYALSTAFNLYDEAYDLVQGKCYHRERPYKHSWVQKANIIYDPAMRMIVPDHLYYDFFTPEYAYLRGDTEAILGLVGYNLNFYSDLVVKNDKDRWELLKTNYCKFIGSEQLIKTIGQKSK